MRAWVASGPALRASGSTAQSGRPALVNAFMKAATRSRQWPHIRLQEFLGRCGWPVSIDTIKQSVRRGKLTPIARLTPKDIRFAAAFYRANPTGDLSPLVAEGSPAASALKLLQANRGVVPA